MVEANWEYKVVKFQTKGWFIGGKLDQEQFEIELNLLGKKGWDLVSVFDTNSNYGQTQDVVATFKRQK